MSIKNIIISILLLIILIIPSFIFLYSNIEFKNNKFYLSNKINYYLEIFFRDNRKLELARANFFYKSWRFDDARKIYEKYKCNSKKECFILNHNMWNNYYYNNTVIDDLDERINLLELSLQSFLNALDIKYDEETKYNYEYVLKQLEKLKKEKELEELRQLAQNDGRMETPPPWMQNPNQDWNNWKEWEENWENWNNWEKNWKENWENWNNWQNKWKDLDDNWNEDDLEIVERWPRRWIWWTQEEAYIPLTSEEKKELENFLRQLEADERNYRHLNKPQRWNIPYDFLNDQNW